MSIGIFTELLPLDPLVAEGIWWSNNITDLRCLPGTFLKSYPRAWKYDDFDAEQRPPISSEILRWEGTYPNKRYIEDLCALSGMPSDRNRVAPLQSAIMILNQLKDPSLSLLVCGTIMHMRSDYCIEYYTTNETWFAFVEIKKCQRFINDSWHIDFATKIAHTEKKIKELHQLQGNDTYGMTVDQIKIETVPIV
jgi:hypothetical protein